MKNDLMSGLHLRMLSKNIETYERLADSYGKQNRVAETLYTDPIPPSPILLAASKLLVAALSCLYVNKPVWRSNPFRTVKATSL